MGGNDVPASGFALYLDTLMDIVKLESAAGLNSMEILVKAEHAQMKDAFKLVTSLHDAGYIAEIQTGDEEPENGNWIIEVLGEEPFFIIKEAVSGKVSEASSINEILKIMSKGDSGHK